MYDGIVQADSATLVARVPLTLAMVCRKKKGDAVVHLSGGPAAVDTARVSGVAVWASDDTWTYYSATWSNLYNPRSDDARQCYDRGADTTGVTAEFVQLHLGGVTAGIPVEGTPIMLYGTLEYTFATSALDSTTTALYVGVQGGTPVELATGMAADAHFEYKKGPGSWQTSVTSGLTDIDQVRIDAHALTPADASSQRNLDFELVSVVPLRNVP